MGFKRIAVKRAAGLISTENKDKTKHQRRKRRTRKRVHKYKGADGSSSTNGNMAEDIRGNAKSNKNRSKIRSKE